MHPHMRAHSSAGDDAKHGPPTPMRRPAFSRLWPHALTGLPITSVGSVRLSPPHTPASSSPHRQFPLLLTLCPRSMHTPTPTPTSTGTQPSNDEGSHTQGRPSRLLQLLLLLLVGATQRQERAGRAQRAVVVGLVEVLTE